MQGILVGHFAEHRRAVNQLAVSGNGAFFASASNDETVKVWDCRRLDKDVSFRSKLTYASQGESCSEQLSCHALNAFCGPWQTGTTNFGGGKPTSTWTKASSSAGSSRVHLQGEGRDMGCLLTCWVLPEEQKDSLEG